MRKCPCGEDATQGVLVEWEDGPGTYWYCPSCADDILETLEGVYPLV